jgi:mRNA interferase RelE/StbE
MVWKIELQRDAERELSKLGHDNARRILKFLHGRLSNLEDPRSIGEALKGPDLEEFWKYRVGDYRIIADIQDDAIRILVLRIGHRRYIYRG